MESLPHHIHRLITDLEAGFDIEASLASVAHIASYDSTLLNILIHFGFSCETSTFVAPPKAEEVVRLLLEEYSSPMSGREVSCEQPFSLYSNDELLESFKRTVYENQIDQFATCSELGLEEIDDSLSLACFWEKNETFDTPKTQSKISLSIDTISPSTAASLQPYESESDSEANRSTRGLRHLTSLVKQVVSSNQATSYKEVAVKLIKKLIVTRGPDRIREEKNVRRRVYDAINVLIAAGVLEKHGKSVTWKEDWDSIEFEELRLQHGEALSKVKVKREELTKVLKNYISVKALLQRNSSQIPQTTKVAFPFIIVSTCDTDRNSVSIFANKAATSVKLQFSQPMTLFGDIDILMKLKMFSIEQSNLRQLLPDEELLKYCPSEF